MPKKGENIYKRKDGRWEGRFACGRTETGRIIYKSIYAHSYLEAKEKLICARMVYGRTLNKEPSAYELSFDKIGRQWLEFIKPKIKESSYIKYHNIFTKYIEPAFGRMNVQDITNIAIEIHLSKLLSSGGKNRQGLSLKTAADVLSVMRQILKFARSSFNIKIADIAELKLKIPVNYVQILSKDEQKHLTDYLLMNRTRMDVGILTALFTGMRIGEICALKNENISLEQKVICVEKTMQRIQTKDEQAAAKTKIILTAPKSISSVRTIPIPSDMVFLFEEYLKNEDSAAFFLTGRRDKIIEPRCMQNYFKRILNQLNLRAVNFHTLRHTFATQCIDLGVDVKTLSEILGHSSVSTTLNKYVHPSLALKRKSMERLNILLAVKKRQLDE